MRLSASEKREVIQVVTVYYQSLLSLLEWNKVHHLMDAGRWGRNFHRHAQGKNAAAAIRIIRYREIASHSCGPYSGGQRAVPQPLRWILYVAPVQLHTDQKALLPVGTNAHPLIGYGNYQLVVFHAGPLTVNDRPESSELDSACPRRFTTMVRSFDFVCQDILRQQLPFSEILICTDLLLARYSYVLA